MSRTRVNTGFVAAGAINANTVLGDNVITANLIKTGAVGPTEIAAGAVSANTKLADGVVTQNVIAAGNVVTSKINDGAVTAAKIAAGNVVTAAINNGAITDAKIATGTISADKLGSGFINANTDFASALIDASVIKADAINPQHIADGAINANTMIAANIIDASNIKAGAVGASELATGAVSANTKMAADVVGAREIRIGNLAAANAVFTHNSATYAKAQLGRVESVTVGAANVTINFANCNIFNLTLGTNSNLNRPSNIAVGQAGTIFVTQDGTGSRTLSYSSVWDFIGGTAPTLTTTASAVDRIDYVVYSTSRIQAVATLAYS